jgi:hypothetical protein
MHQYSYPFEYAILNISNTTALTTKQRFFEEFGKVINVFKQFEPTKLITLGNL